MSTPDLKLFRIDKVAHLDSSDYRGVVCNAQGAALMGWDSPAQAWSQLDALELGQAVEDDDGETWSRIA